MINVLEKQIEIMFKSKYEKLMNKSFDKFYKELYPELEQL